MKERSTAAKGEGPFGRRSATTAALKGRAKIWWLARPFRAGRIAEDREKPGAPASSPAGSSTWKSLLRGGALAAGGLGAAVLGVSAYTAYRLSRPDRSTARGESSENYEGVSFPAADGLQLGGWFLPGAGSYGAVILCHGFQTSRREMLPLALGLQGRGFHVLLFDFRAHGESEGQWTSCGLHETRDVEGAVRYLQARPEVQGNQVGVVGFSMGAAVALLAAARLAEIAAVVADSSFATLREVATAGFAGFDHLPRFPFAPLTLWFAERLVGGKVEEVRPLDAIPELAPRPVFLIHGTEDPRVPLAEAYLLYEAAGEPRELWTVAGARHVEARLIDFPGYLERVDGFLKKHLAPKEEAVLP